MWLQMRNCFFYVQAVSCIVGRACLRIENTELLFPHLKIGHDAAMKAVVGGMEGQRTSVPQKLMAAPLAVELEDETVEDDDDVDEELPQAVEEPQVIADDPEEIPSVCVFDVDETPAEETPVVDTTLTKEMADRIAMPPPPPRPPPTSAPTVPESTPEDPKPPPSSTTPPNDQDTERETLLHPGHVVRCMIWRRQLDLLRLKFKQSVTCPFFAETGVNGDSPGYRDRTDRCFLVAVRR